MSFNNKKIDHSKLTKEEFLRHLNSDKAYYSILKAASTPDEKKKVKSQVESFITTMFDALMPVFSMAAQDPEAMNKISEALKTGDGIIKESDGSPIVSGSKG